MRQTLACMRNPPPLPRQMGPNDHSLSRLYPPPPLASLSIFSLSLSLPLSLSRPPSLSPLFPPPLALTFPHPSHLHPPHPPLTVTFSLSKPAPSLLPCPAPYPVRARPPVWTREWRGPLGLGRRERPSPPRHASCARCLSPRDAFLRTSCPPTPRRALPTAPWKRHGRKPVVSVRSRPSESALASQPHGDPRPPLPRLGRGRGVPFFDLGGVGSIPATPPRRRLPALLIVARHLNDGAGRGSAPRHWCRAAVPSPQPARAAPITRPINKHTGAPWAALMRISDAPPHSPGPAGPGRARPGRDGTCRAGPGPGAECTQRPWHWDDALVGGAARSLL
jgi:hypothetical protein